MDNKRTVERYDNLDGFRSISCLCIIGMHIQANSRYQIRDWIYNTLVPSWTHLVPFFLMISGFGMFCGYYEKIKKGTLDLNTFYTKRYRKIFPFFAFLLFLDVVLDHSAESIMEGLTEATLVFGLLPNNHLSVIGVAWTLGVIFLFYMLFPFCVFLCWNKQRAAFALGVSMAVSFFCSIYFFSEQFVVSNFAVRHNFLYCAPFFIGGGYIYLYRKEITNLISKHRWETLLACVLVSGLYYMIPLSVAGTDISMIKNIILFSAWLCYGISVESRFLNNKAMHFFSAISLEMYLAHMVIYRVVEKTGLLYVLGDGWAAFLFSWGLTVGLLVVFVKAYKIFSLKLIQRWKQRI